MSEQSDNSVSEEKLHYESLMKFFKSLVWGITILTGIAAIMIGNSVSDIKAEIRGEISDIKKEIETLKSSTLNTIAETNKLSDNYLTSLKDNTESYLNHSKYVTKIQIDAIKEESKYLALQAARNRIEEAFETKNIEGMIDDVANQKLDVEIEKLIDNQLDDINNTLKFIPELAIHMDGLRSGNEESYFQLDSISKYHPTEIVRTSARSVLMEKAPGYFSSLDLDYIFESDTDWLEKLLNLDTTQFSNKNYVSTKCNELKQKILKDGTDPTEAINCYGGIIFMTRIDSIRMFDFNQLRKMKF